MPAPTLIGPCPPFQLPNDYSLWGPTPSLSAAGAAFGKDFGEGRGQWHWPLSELIPNTIPVIWINADTPHTVLHIAQLAKDIVALPNEQMVIVRLMLEGTNVARKGWKDAIDFCTQYDQAVQIMRNNGCTKERAIFTADFCPTSARVKPEDLGAWIPESAQGIGLDLYTIESLQPNNIIGQRTLKLTQLAMQRKLPLYVLESGIAKPGMEYTIGAKQLFDRIRSFVEIYNVKAWMMTSYDWRLHAVLKQYWSNGHLSSNPEMLAYVRDSMAKMKLIRGPIAPGNLDQTLASIGSKL